MGYMSTGRGVVVHRTSCRNLANFQKHSEKWISVSWENQIDTEFQSSISVDTINKPGVLAEVASVIGDGKSNIEQVEVLGRHENCSVIQFLILVRNRQHLASIIRSVHRMKNVVRVTRDCA
jgi:(p)ppGpp synthase/HD superfamily hydrolase